MPTLANQTKQDYTGSRGRWKRIAAALNRLARFVNNLVFEYPLAVDPAGDSNRIFLDPQAGDLLLPILLTTAPDANGYYRGDVYGDGILEAATLTDQVVHLVGWDALVDGIVPQGFYYGWVKVVDISGTDTSVYQVLPQTPVSPASGVYAMLDVDGVRRMLQVVNCDGEPV